jgi:hypothetical protein
MSWERLWDLASGCLIVCWVVAYLLLLSAEGKFAHDPQVADPLTGHVLPLTLKGTGTVYLTVWEWKTVAPYQKTAFFFAGALIVLLGGRMVVEGYQGFIRGYRNSN